MCRLKDADTIGAPSMGVVSFSAQKLVEGEVFDGWFDLLDLASKPLKGCSIRATLSFRQVTPLSTGRRCCDFCVLTKTLHTPVHPLRKLIGIMLWTQHTSAVSCDDRATLPDAASIAVVARGWISLVGLGRS